MPFFSGTRIISPSVKRPNYEARYSRVSGAELRKCGVIPPFSHTLHDAKLTKGITLHLCRRRYYQLNVTLCSVSLLRSNI